MTTPQHTKGKSMKETVAERAVRGYLAGYIHGLRSVAAYSWTDGTVTATVYVRLPKASVEEMLAREQASKKPQKRSKPRGK